MKIEDIEVYDEDRNEFGETPLMKACANGDYGKTNYARKGVKVADILKQKYS